jgi:hypothetical protein
MTKNNPNKVDCFKCIYFKITWDKQKPYGCTAMGFKSKLLPSLEVYKNSGNKCLMFKKKL